MKTVKQIEIKSGMSVGELVREMEAAGVLGAGKIGEASKIVAEMFGDPRCTVFLTLAGPLVPGGLRKIIANLLEGGYVDVIVTTGANLVHDMVESLGFKHYRGTFKADDKVLKDEEIGRIGDIYIEQKAFQGLEDWLYKFFDELPSEMKRRISITDLLTEIGRRLPDKNSILATAARKGVPIICPAFLDSIAGFHLWMYGQDGKINVDPLLDVSRLM
ncbi:MAG TPA: deoxyhypusine synthase, partial [Candidatus Bathyarchaeota archaeon]|nr:deoxyhypusine synthase [Candidatus Bathyarchaeota archaeon]